MSNPWGSEEYIEPGYGAQPPAQQGYGQGYGQYGNSGPQPGYGRAQAPGYGAYPQHGQGYGYPQPGGYPQQESKRSGPAFFDDMNPMQMFEDMFQKNKEPEGVAPPPYGYGAPGYGAPGYGAPQYGAPQYGGPQYGGPGYGGYGAPNYGGAPYGGYR